MVIVSERDSERKEEGASEQEGGVSSKGSMKLQRFIEWGEIKEATRRDGREWKEGEKIRGECRG